MEKEFLSLIAQFNILDVEYVVGRLAVNAHGYSRYTDDLDVLIRPSPAKCRARCARWCS